MKIAVATDNGNVARHFGRCPCYTLAFLEKGQIKEQQVIENPGHQPGFLPGFLAEKNIDCIIAGGMGQRAQKLFSNKDIQTITGITGEVENVLEKMARGRLHPGEDLCER